MKSYTSSVLSNHVKFQIEIAKYYLLTYAVNDNQIDTATSPHKTIDKNAWIFKYLETYYR